MARNRKQFMRYTVMLILILLSGGIVIVLLIPSPIEATYWHPPQPPQLTGALSVNDMLHKAELLTAGTIEHPEDIAFDNMGRLYTGSSDGFVYRVIFDEDGEVQIIEQFAETGGYPLGLHFDGNGDLVVAVKDIGLVSITPNASVTKLTDTVNGTPILYADEVDIAADGTIYFSDGSTKYSWGWPYDLLENQPHGRLLTYDPRTKETRILLEGLYFANGVVLAPDESYLLIVESFRYRIQRLWLTGERAGSTEIFAHNLPNIPDNLAIDDNGFVWVGGNLRSPFIDSLHRYPFLKNQFAKLGVDFLRDLQGPANRYGFVLLLDANGAMSSSFHDKTGRVYGISSAQPYGEYVYFGTAIGATISRISVP